MKTLVIYGTRRGSTARSAQLIAETLRAEPGMEAVVVDARRVRRPMLESADAFVLGSSIVMDRWKGSARRLLPRLAATGRKAAVFVTAAGTLSGLEPGNPTAPPSNATLEQAEAKAISKYVDAVVPLSGLEPVAVAAFGGRMAFFGKEVVNNWNADRIAAWARGLPKLLRG